LARARLLATLQQNHTKIAAFVEVSGWASLFVVMRISGARYDKLGLHRVAGFCLIQAKLRSEAMNFLIIAFVILMFAYFGFSAFYSLRPDLIPSFIKPYIPKDMLPQEDQPWSGVEEHIMCAIGDAYFANDEQAAAISIRMREGISGLGVNSNNDQELRNCFQKALLSRSYTQESIEEYMVRLDRLLTLG
jgi:hypothetical protein